MPPVTNFTMLLLSLSIPMMGNLLYTDASRTLIAANDGRDFVILWSVVDDWFGTSDSGEFWRQWFQNYLPPCLFGI